METVLLQVNSDKAYKLIEDLEALNIVKVLSKTAHPSTKLSEKFAGAMDISDAEYEEFQQSLINGRNEWERDI